MANEDAKRSFPAHPGVYTGFFSDLVSRCTTANGQRQLPSVQHLPVQRPSGLDSATMLTGNGRSLSYFTKRAPYQAKATGGCNSFLSSYCQQVKSLDLSRGESMEGNNLLLESRKKEQGKRGDVCTAVSQRWKRTVMGIVC